MQERLVLYQSAVESARQAGDSAKMRRYDRGLKVSRPRAGLCLDPGALSSEFLSLMPTPCFRHWKTCWPLPGRATSSMKQTSRHLSHWGKDQQPGTATPMLLPTWLL